ncbi:DUF6236 family protein [Xanthobacter autotrophicus]|uniref:DUF6236 family protein n=1 Tax=Xanthobacter autotrophicus TaxID=280 RepID=UPI00372A30C0
MAERGLVISCPIIAHQDRRGLQLRDTNLDPQDLRFSLLFWDKLNWPKSNVLSIESSGDAEYLSQIGILERRNMPTPIGTFSLEKVFLDGHVRAYKDLDRLEPGVWSLGKGENSIDFGPNDLEEGRGVLVRLYNAIPVPSRDVPIEDVLNFKAKCMDELIELRLHLDDIYEKIISSKDGDLALEREIVRLDKSISDYLKKSKGFNIPFIGSSFDANINVSAAAFSGIGIFSATLSLTAALTAGAVAGFGIGPTISLKGRQEVSTPFRYISSFHDRLF